MLERVGCTVHVMERVCMHAWMYVVRGPIKMVDGD